MNPPRLRSPAATAVETFHPVVLERRIRDILLTGLSALLPAVLALSISLALPQVSLPMVLAVIAVSLGIVALILSSRLEVTVALVALYLGLLDGPVKLLFPGRELTASVQDILILAVCVGAVMRLIANRERVRLPALSAWVIVWVAVVVMNVFNPWTAGILHVLGGFRTLLQWVPFFFFGYYLMRSKRRFRQFFIIMGVMALANGVVAAYQTELSPTQLASWGPGYQNLVHPSEGVHSSAQVYTSEGEARVRPPGLGSDEGFSGAIGHIALPMCLALLMTIRRRRWLAALLCIGAVVATVVGLGRLPLIAAGLAVIAFGALVVLSGRRVTRLLLALVLIVALAIPAGAILASTLRSGTFKRYENINTSSSTTLHHEAAWKQVPSYIAAAPFGFGLGISGPGAGLGGRANDLIEGHGLTAETEYNLLAKELGAPGLILWAALLIYIIVLTVRGIRWVRDGDLAVDLAGTMAAFMVFPIVASVADIVTSEASGPYFWFVIGVAAYWFAGPGRARLGSVDVDGHDAQSATA